MERDLRRLNKSKWRAKAKKSNERYQLLGQARVVESVIMILMIILNIRAEEMRTLKICNFTPY